MPFSDNVSHLFALPLWISFQILNLYSSYLSSVAGGQSWWSVCPNARMMMMMMRRVCHGRLDSESKSVTCIKPRRRDIIVLLMFNANLISNRQICRQISKQVGLYETSRRIIWHCSRIISRCLALTGLWHLILKLHTSFAACGDVERFKVLTCLQLRRLPFFSFSFFLRPPIRSPGLNSKPSNKPGAGGLRSRVKGRSLDRCQARIWS